MRYLRYHNFCSAILSVFNSGGKVIVQTASKCNVFVESARDITYFNQKFYSASTPFIDFTYSNDIQIFSSNNEDVTKEFVDAV